MNNQMFGLYDQEIAMLREQVNELRAQGKIEESIALANRVITLTSRVRNKRRSNWYNR